MCPPIIAAASFLVSAGSAIAGFVGQQQQAAAQDAYYEDNRQRALNDLVNKYGATQERSLQEAEAAAAEKQDVRREGRAARATAEVAAGEANITGTSVSALLRDAYGREATYTDRVDQQREWSATQMRREQTGFRAQAEDRINSVQRGQRPSFADLGLRLVGAGLSSYNVYDRAANGTFRRTS